MKLERKIINECKALDKLDPIKNRIEYNSRFNHLRKLVDRYESQPHRFSSRYEALNVYRRVYHD